MRSSTLLLLLVALLALSATTVTARHHRRVGALKPVKQDTPQEVALPVACLAKCAGKLALCVAKCKLFGDEQLGLSCNQKCAASSAICAGECALHGPVTIDSNTIDQVFSQQVFEESKGTRAHTLFQGFKQKFAKRYATPELEAHRFAIFQENMLTVERLNKDNPEATFGENEFSDLHALEFQRMYLNYRPGVGDEALLRKNIPVAKSNPNVKLPTSYDWRTPDQGRPVGVTKVKDQGQCGSCWAFSAVEQLESAWILGGNEAVELSTEQVVDCDKVDLGCNGGDTIVAYEYMQKAGIESEANYPYRAGTTGRAGACVANSSAVVARMTGWNYATPMCTDSCLHQDEELLKTNLYNLGPVSICVDASSWQFYTGGILTPASGCSGNYYRLNHCVQLTGYGVDPSGKAYWSARNSWATRWGEQGYIRLSYGTNTCGLADEATQIEV